MATFTLGTDVVLADHSNLVADPSLIGTAAFGLFTASACYDNVTATYALWVDDGTWAGISTNFTTAPSNAVGGYTIIPQNNYTADLEFCGSTDGSTWTSLDYRSAASINVNLGAGVSFSLSAQSSTYTYYATMIKPSGAIGQNADFEILTGTTEYRKGRAIVVG